MFESTIEHVGGERGVLSPSNNSAPRGRRYRFKVADTADEIEQIHRLNYRTFVEEIPQHGPNPEGRLVDKFHAENDYIIGLCGGRVVGMLAVRDRRPFSLDAKLENLDSHLPRHRSICEVRLLSIEREHRGTRIVQGLFTMLKRYCDDREYDLGVASGAVTQLRLYRHLGFVPFGPLVGKPGAQYQPMYLTMEVLNQRCGQWMEKEMRDEETPMVNLMTGPVEIRPEVERAFRGPARSHRSRAFIQDFREMRKRLCRLVGAREVEILTGAATSGNDAVGGQLSLERGQGLILSNGEFGERLIDHGHRWRLDFHPVRWGWGEAMDRERIDAALEQHPRVTWIWGVHCETSTGVLNDLDLLKKISREREIKLSLDAISSIGTIPVDLSGVWLASGTSGKALGAYPGLAMVFFNHRIEPQPRRLPRCLDLGYYGTNSGVPFTLNSNLVDALGTALREFDRENPYREIHEISGWLRPRIRDLGYQIVAPDAVASPAVVTIALPDNINSRVMGDQARDAGLLICYESGYLLERNWIQICMMGATTREGLERVLDFLGKWVGDLAASSSTSREFAPAIS